MGVATCLGDPPSKPIRPFRAADVGPIAEQLQHAARCQELCADSDQVLDQPIGWPIGLPVGQPLACYPLRRYHIRRIGDDQVERLLGDRGEEITQAQINLDRVDLRVHLGQLDGTRVEICCNDSARMLHQVQALHPAAGAKIKSTIDRAANGQLRQGDGGGGGAEHEVGPNRGDLGV